MGTKSRGNVLWGVFLVAHGFAGVNSYWAPVCKDQISDCASAIAHPNGSELPCLANETLREVCPQSCGLCVRSDKDIDSIRRLGDGDVPAGEDCENLLVTTDGKDGCEMLVDETNENTTKSHLCEKYFCPTCSLCYSCNKMCDLCEETTEPTTTESTSTPTPTTSTEEPKICLGVENVWSDAVCNQFMGNDICDELFASGEKHEGKCDKACQFHCCPEDVLDTCDVTKCDTEFCPGCSQENQCDTTCGFCPSPVDSWITGTISGEATKCKAAVIDETLMVEEIEAATNATKDATTVAIKWFGDSKFVLTYSVKVARGEPELAKVFVRKLQSVTKAAWKSAIEKASKEKGEDCSFTIIDINVETGCPNVHPVFLQVDPASETIASVAGALNVDASCFENLDLDLKPIGGDFCARKPEAATIDTTYNMIRLPKGTTLAQVGTAVCPLGPPLTIHELGVPGPPTTPPPPPPPPTGRGTDDDDDDGWPWWAWLLLALGILLLLCCCLLLLFCLGCCPCCGRRRKEEEKEKTVEQVVPVVDPEAPGPSAIIVTSTDQATETKSTEPDPRQITPIIATRLGTYDQSLRSTISPRNNMILTRDKENMLRIIFDFADRDRDNHLDRSEMYQAVHRSKYFAEFVGVNKDTKIGQVFYQMDRDRDNQISFDEFCQWYLRGRRMPISPIAEEFLFARIIFGRLDHNNDGNLKDDEFERQCAEDPYLKYFFSEEGSDQVIREQFKSMDFNGDGVVTFDEFCRWYLHRRGGQNFFQPVNTSRSEIPEAIIHEIEIHWQLNSPEFQSQYSDYPFQDDKSVECRSARFADRNLSRSEDVSSDQELEVKFRVNLPDDKVHGSPHNSGVPVWRPLTNNSQNLLQSRPIANHPRSFESTTSSGSSEFPTHLQGGSHKYISSKRQPSKGSSRRSRSKSSHKVSGQGEKIATKSRETATNDSETLAEVTTSNRQARSQQNRDAESGRMYPDIAMSNRQARSLQNSDAESGRIYPETSVATSNRQARSLQNRGAESGRMYPESVASSNRQARSLQNRDAESGRIYPETSVATSKRQARNPQNRGAESGRMYPEANVSLPFTDVSLGVSEAR